MFPRNFTNQEELEKTSSKAEVIKRNPGSRRTLTQRKEAREKRNCQSEGGVGERDAVRQIKAETIR